MQPHIEFSKGVSPDFTDSKLSKHQALVAHLKKKRATLPANGGESILRGGNAKFKLRQLEILNSSPDKEVTLRRWQNLTRQKIQEQRELNNIVFDIMN